MMLCVQIMILLTMFIYSWVMSRFCIAENGQIVNHVSSEEVVKALHDSEGKIFIKIRFRILA